MEKRENGVEMANCEMVSHFSKGFNWKAFRLFALKLAGEMTQIKASA